MAGFGNEVTDRKSDFVGVPLRRAVERIGVFGLNRAVREQVDSPLVAVTVVETVHPRPTQVGVDQPASAEYVFIADAGSDHKPETFAVTVFEFDFPVFNIRLGYVETHHAEVASEIPASVVTFEVVAVFAHQDAEQGVFAPDGFPRGEDDFALYGGMRADGKFDGRVDNSDKCI